MLWSFTKNLYNNFIFYKDHSIMLFKISYIIVNNLDILYNPAFENNIITHREIFNMLNKKSYNKKNILKLHYFYKGNNVKSLII